MQANDLTYPTLKELKAIEADVRRLRAEALRDMGRSIAAFFGRLITPAAATQGKHA